MTEFHNIPPVWSESSKTLILGSFPSVKSREQAFFYAHPQNRFWRVLAALYGTPVPETVPEKKALLQSNSLALWDVVSSCDIKGSSDVSLKNARPNDIGHILKNSRVSRVFTNGKTAFSLYEKLIFPETRVHALYLPSTSPANMQFSFEALLREWRAIL
ncbi:MAG: DNA-deoxyinosine glycosylase [Clostridia bacterium]|nr:DNA-deoxyinosine glycosylase [Clostridia bacterium]